MPLNAKFFDVIKATSLYPDILSQSSVDGLNALYNSVEKRGLTFIDPIAYMMATVYREAGPGFKPDVREVGMGKGKKYGVPTGPYNQVYYGRGWPQLTWDYNYAKFQKRLGIPLSQQPDLALTLENTAVIMFDGMYFGIFTGIGLQKYFVQGKDTPDENWLQARRTVNGLDHSAEIAANAHHFLDALRVGIDPVKTTVVLPKVPTSTALPPLTTPQPLRRGLLADLERLFGSKH